MIIGQSRIFGTAPATDPDFASTVLLLGGEGNFTDQSAAVRGTGTGSGTATTSTTQAKFGSRSMSFPAGGGLVQFPDHADFHFGSGAYTVEFFLYLSATGFQFIVGQWENSGHLSWLVYESSGTINLGVSTTGSNTFFDVVGSTALSTGGWRHVCIDCDGAGTTRLYVDGAMDAKSTTARTLFTTPAIPFGIGGSSNTGGSPMNGYVDELRITKGVARYHNDSGFAVPTAPFPRF